MNNNHPPTSQISEKTIERILTIQEKDLIVKTQEIELRKQNDKNNFEYAKLALDGNVKDREAERVHKSKSFTNTLIFSGLVVIGFFVFLSLAIIYGKDALAEEIVKAILYLGSGGISGFAIGKNWKKEENK